MPNRVDIDTSHSLAIVKKIGERLSASLEEDRELPVSFRNQIERLRQLESDAHDARASGRLQPDEKF